MQKNCRRFSCFLLMLALLAIFPALAQTDDDEATTRDAGTTGRLTSSTDRLFLSFVEDGMIVDSQWWEGQLQYLDGDPGDATLLTGTVAFQPWSRIEVGGRVGFGRSDTPPGIPDGTGATDLDLWGKMYFHQGDRPTEFTVGGVVTVPTGDDTAGLGTDAFALRAFGAMRYRLDKWVFSGHIGLQMNGDGSVFGSPDLDGELSPSISGAAIVPWSDRVSFVGEARFEGNRFEGGDNDIRALAGINWRLRNRGIARFAFGVGLADGAPDAQLTAGYAVSF